MTVQVFTSSKVCCCITGKNRRTKILRFYLWPYCFLITITHMKHILSTFLSRWLTVNTAEPRIWGLGIRRLVCLFTPQISMVLIIALTHGGMARLSWPPVAGCCIGSNTFQHLTKT